MSDTVGLLIASCVGAIVVVLYFIDDMVGLKFHRRSR
jgi:hypothetical protein